MSCRACGAAEAKKRCGRCRAVAYCSKECQRLHWKSHRAVCDFLAAPVPDDLERENEHSNVVEHEEESNMALTSSLPSTSAARTKKSVACRTCKGEGKVSREKPNLLPFPRLESRTASFVLRELTCPDCDGFGTTVANANLYESHSQMPSESNSQLPCYRCQAPDRECCTCSLPSS
mmetsp:Transcript_41793/g.131782  ORF Transcript_41793/g.131782 Transcript_41793/m.131782 type:complete len:176 (-) Transcript_41793:2686-3213(-)